MTLVALAFLPGAALALTLTPGPSRMRAVALLASPSITYGLIGIAVGWSGHLGARWSPLTILWLEAAVVAVALTVRLVRRGRRRPPAWGQGREHIRRLLRVYGGDLTSLGLAATAALVVSWVLVGSLPSAPGWDAMNHSFLLSRVIGTGSGLASDVCVTGGTASTPACDFYPLAPHVLWAQAVELTGAGATAVILASIWVVIPLTAVTGVYGAVRAFGARPAIAGAAAFLPMLIGPLWPSLVTGRITVLLGAALAPSVALLFWLAFRIPRAPAVLAMAATGLVGIFLSHTYDALAAAFLLVGLLVTSFPVWSWRRWVQLIVAGALGLVLMAPDLLSLLDARSERLDTRPVALGPSLWQTLRQIVIPTDAPIGTLIAPAAVQSESLPIPLGHIGTAVSALLTVLLLVGAVASLLPRFRWARPFAVAHLGMLVVAVFVAVDLGPVHDILSSLFYNDPRRVRWSSALAPGVLTLAGAMAVVQAIAHMVAALTRARAHDGREPTLADGGEAPTPPTSAGLHVAGTGRAAARRQSLVAVAAVVCLSALVLNVPETATARDRLAARAMPNDPAYARTTEWLRGRTGAVAEDFHRDFVPWMTLDAGLPLLRGIEPLSGPKDAQWRKRVQLWRVLIGVQKSPTACLVNNYDVQWVIVGGPAMVGGRRTWNLPALTRSPFLRLARVDGPIRVYAVHDPCKGR
ncbi:MAG: DUF6541 family protein [Terracoccus sp.]